MKNKRRQRLKKKKIRRFPRLVVFLLSLLLIASAVLFILNLPAWEIKEVVVNGAKMLSSEDVRGLSGVPLSENLFFADLDRARTNLRRVPSIKSFKLYRIPPQTVLISIKERQPIAAVVLENRSVVVDDEGVIINQNQNVKLDIANLAELPVVSGLDSKTMVEKGRLKPAVARVVADIILKLSPYLESRQMQLDLGGLKEVSFLLDDLLKVKLGNAQDIKQKMAVFEALFPVVDNKWDKVKYIDVRYPDYPVIKYR